MFSIDKFCEDAYQGRPVEDLQGFCGYMNQFQDVILWGAGNLGEAVGRKLIELGIHLSAYWDAKYHDLHNLNNIKVLRPFTGNFYKEKTLVVFCITNLAYGSALLSDLAEDGWTNCLKGVAVLEALLCPFEVKKPVDPSICAEQKMCTVCSCQRLINLMKTQAMEREKITEEDVLSFDRIHIIVNNFCNLKCTHCCMYMNSYPAESRWNVNVDTLRQDLQLVMNAVHSFGVVNVFGGEPFLHPQLDDIIKALLQYQNYGTLIINTNGAAKMRDEQMENMKSSRVRLGFSNYKGALTQSQEETVLHKLNHAKELGINAQMMNELPVWSISSTLYDNHCSIDEMKKIYSQCETKFLYLFDHKVYPCTFCLSLKELGIADYKDTYIDLDVADTPQKLREAIKNIYARGYFSSCGHCDGGTCGLAPLAGEQGYSERYALPQKT